MASVLSVRDLAYGYAGSAQPVFRNLDLRVEPGEFVAIVGQSGVGKSTLLRCVAQLVPAARGEVELAVPSEATARPFGFVFQDTRLMPWRRVRGNVACGLKGLQLDATQRDARLREVLSLARIGELADRWPRQLSGGQAQRVGIARALALHPRVLLMDEPFSAVDAITRQALQDELLRIWEQRHPAVLFVTHDIEEAVYLADRVVVLAGTPAGVVTDRSIDLARPRDRAAPELQAVAREITAAL
ncbi:MAG: ABC transporter ATP-binding protein [Castellaniella sp.]|uniref:ABC transporter ATP-binding protein n=1 Tax=Castellaniella sp. TaxID=1955812 RepID=UPI0012178CA0|nr:ABC transporter ATP-binding protein [Castellaniella sp.]TAN29534.1 MAG: ABC transporter ATP-binding protein [Castellaniella sp.]